MRVWNFQWSGGSEFFLLGRGEWQTSVDLFHSLFFELDLQVWTGQQPLGLSLGAWYTFWLHGQLLAPIDQMKLTGNTSGESLQLANPQSVVLWPLALSSWPHGEDELAEQTGLPGPWAPCNSRGQSADPCRG